MCPCTPLTPLLMPEIEVCCWIDSNRISVVGIDSCSVLVVRAVKANRFGATDRDIDSSCSLDLFTDSWRKPLCCSIYAVIIQREGVGLFWCKWKCASTSTRISNRTGRVELYCDLFGQGFTNSIRMFCAWGSVPISSCCYEQSKQKREKQESNEEEQRHFCGSDFGSRQVIYRSVRGNWNIAYRFLKGNAKLASLLFGKNDVCSKW